MPKWGKPTPVSGRSMLPDLRAMAFARRLSGVFRLRQGSFSGKMRAAIPTMASAESGAEEPPPALYKAA